MVGLGWIPDIKIIQPDIRSGQIFSYTLMKLSGLIFDNLIFYISSNIEILSYDVTHDTFQRFKLSKFMDVKN